jgi:phage gp45-like
LNIVQKVKSLIRTAILKAIIDDGVHQQGDFSFLGVEQRGVVYSPYGLYSNPEKGAFAVLLQVGGKEDSLVALVSNPKDRPELEKGGVALQSSGGKMSVICHKDGKIEIKGTTQEMVAVLSSAIENISNLIDAVASVVVPPTGGAPSGLKGLITPTVYDPLKALVDTDKTNLDTMKK